VGEISQDIRGDKSENYKIVGRQFEQFIKEGKR